MTRPSRAQLVRRFGGADCAQQAALPGWRELLRRTLGTGLGPEEAAAELRVPTRRQVLRIGGTAFAGSFVLVACAGGDDGDDESPRPSTTTPPDPAAVVGPELDLVLANTALSLEVLAVEAYQVALDRGLVETAEVRDAITLFQSHHAAHRDALVAVVQAAGEEPFTVANPVVRAGFVDPALSAASGEADLLRLAYDIEHAAAQTYVHSTGRLSTAELRARSASIAGVEARHAAILDDMGELANERPSLYPATNPWPVDAMVTG